MRLLTYSASAILFFLVACSSPTEKTTSNMPPDSVDDRVASIDARPSAKATKVQSDETVSAVATPNNDANPTKTVTKANTNTTKETPEVAKASVPTKPKKAKTTKKSTVKEKATVAKKEVTKAKENTIDKVVNTVESVKTETKKAATRAVKTTKEVVTTNVETVKKAVSVSPIDQYDAFLRKYISADGFVQYGKMKTDRQGLDAFIEWANNNPGNGNTRDEKMAYWINVYNANTIKLILDNYPIGSIMELGDGKIWKKKWIKMKDATRGLDQIEHEILRAKYPDPRIHFAVNCAAFSCPPILNKAWRASSLEKTFEQQARNFINNKRYNDPAAGKLSQIFNWYQGDFGDLKTYVNKYANNKIPAGTELEFLEYKWNLNGK